MPKSTSNAIKLFLFGVIVGLCISMMLTFVYFSNYGDILSSIVTSADYLQMSFAPENAEISIFDAIKSPSNQIPVHLNKSTNNAQKVKKERKDYYGGGDIDPTHLGGFFPNDTNSYERQLWEWAIDKFNIKSVMDVGCGQGYSTDFFVRDPRINDVLCIEGSSDAIQHSLVANYTIQHDFTLGPYWPEKSYDMVWCVEFLEHVEEKYMSHYMATFKKAKLLFVTAAVLGGWHHVNMHKSEYWIEVFQSYGFIYLKNITRIARDNCPGFSWQLKYSYHNTKDNGDRKMPYFYYTGLVFLNPLFLGMNTNSLPTNSTLFDEMLQDTLH